MICPHCHSENRDGAKFCNECGTNLSEAPAFDVSGVETPTIDENAAFDEPVDDAVAPKGPSDDDLLEFDERYDEDATSENAEEIGEDIDDIEEPPDQVSGSIPGLDGLKLPTIEIAGVNVDDEGRAFDSGSLDPGKTADLGRAVSSGTDLSGIDEFLVGAGYVPPRATWRAGDTMEMPRIDDAPKPQAKEFRAPDKNVSKGNKGKIALIVLAVVAILGLSAAGITYYLELWGGKMLPDVVGMTQTDASFVLEGKGFTVRATQVKSDETEGVVLLMDPSAGARQEVGSEVVIHVSVSRSVPDVVGKQRDEAATLLKQEGFENVTIATEKSNETEGLVLSITPESGEKAKAATPITVTVAVPYTVPDVAGMSWKDASAALSAEGYAAQATYVYSESVASGTVIGTDPVAGTKLSSGSAVTVQIAKSRGTELEEAALAYLQSVGSVTIGNTTYQIASVDSVKYAGNDQTTFTITGYAVTTLDGETVRGSAKQKSGTITWNSSNAIVSIA